MPLFVFYAIHAILLIGAAPLTTWSMGKVLKGKLYEVDLPMYSLVLGVTVAVEALVVFVSLWIFGNIFYG